MTGPPGVLIIPGLLSAPRVAEFRQALLQLSKDIMAEYNERLNPGLAQQRYDDLTDHSRNDRNAKEAAAQAIREAQM